MVCFKYIPKEIRLFKIYLVKAVIFHKGRKYIYPECVKRGGQLIKEEIAEDLFQSLQILSLVHQGQKKILKPWSFSENMLSKTYSGVHLELCFKT